MISSKLKPFMAYLGAEQHRDLKRFSQRNKIAMSQLIREAVDARITQGDRYVAGYNKALHDAIDAIYNNRAAKMKFPSGKSFADVFNEEIQKLIITESHVQKPSTSPAQASSSGRNEGGSGTEDESDQGLGV